jgi:sulfate adenylyltransferase
MTIPPHGGVLVDRILTGTRRDEAAARAGTLPSVELSERQAREVENLALGVYSPLPGFLRRADFDAVLASARLGNGVVWTIPIVLDVADEVAARVAAASRGSSTPEIALCFEGNPFALMKVEERYPFRRDDYCKAVFGTLDEKHPGVAHAATMGAILLGGDIEVIDLLRTRFPKHRLSPRDTRARFEENGWRTVVGFQTRNIPHVGHEALQKAALNLTDGLFINPLVGGKKAGDFEDPVIVAAYEALVQNYYPADRAVLGILQGQMRYAGPKEAIFHAIQRKNFGCTHFIIGRDHAGVGTFYPPYAAQEIFGDFPDLGVTPLFFAAFFKCRRCQGMVNEKICPHRGADRVDFSGTRLREAILKGDSFDGMIRPEVSEAIRQVDGGPIRGA